MINIAETPVRGSSVFLKSCQRHFSPANYVNSEGVQPIDLIQAGARLRHERSLSQVDAFRLWRTGAFAEGQSATRGMIRHGYSANVASCQFVRRWHAFIPEALDLIRFLRLR